MVNFQGPFALHFHYAPFINLVYMVFVCQEVTRLGYLVKYQIFTLM